MSSRYKKQEIIVQIKPGIYKIKGQRVICCDDYEDEPPSMIAYNSEEEFNNAMEKEKTRKVGGTFYNDNITGYDLLEIYGRN